LARRRELGALWPLAYTILAFALVMLILSFGQYSFLFPLTAWIPGLRSFRMPCRYLLLFQLAMTGLATIGFKLVLQECQQASKQHIGGLVYRSRHFWLTLWRDFEPLWFLVGVAAAVAVAGIKLRHEGYVASIPAVLAGPVLMAVAVAILVAAVRGYAIAMVGLILLTAVDLGYYGLSYSGCWRSAPLDAFVASVRTPPGEPDGRVLASLLRFDQPGLRTGDAMTLCGWRRADGYAGLEPQRRLDYSLLPALRVAGVRWVQGNASTLRIEGLKPHDGLWLEVPDPLPRVRLVTQCRTSADPARDIAQIDPETTALCEVPLALPVSEPGKAILTAESPGHLEIEVECPASQLLVVAESYHPGWCAVVDARPQELFRVNGDFMGCLVPPGKHRVVLAFQPSSLSRGWTTSYLGLSLLGICFLGALFGAKTPSAECDQP